MKRNALSVLIRSAYLSWKTALITLAFAVGMTAEATGQQEEILNYHTRIEWRTDRSILVTETLEVRVLGQVIKRGLTRFLPGSRYLNDRQVNVDYDIVEIRRDGKKEPYKTESSGGGKMLYIGSKDVFLQPGVYTYDIVYEVDDQVGFYEEYDELYWNAIGTEVQFPIRKASCELILPEGARLVQQAAYVGVRGSQDQDFSYEQSGQSLKYTVNRELRPYEGFSVAVGIEKGLIETPGIMDRMLSVLLIALASIFLLPYYIYTWYKHGQDPPTPASYPMWEPPQKLSPASLNYIKLGRYHNRCLTASIVNMAIKSYIKIEEEVSKVLIFTSRTFKLIKLKEAGNDLSPEERKLFNKLFRSKSIVTVEAKYDPTIERSYQAHKNSLNGQHSAFIWKGHNGKLVVLPALATLGTIITAIVVYANSNYVDPLALKVILGFVPLSIIALIAYIILIRKPSSEKLALRSKIKGFEMYLEMAEKDRIQVLNPPDMTPEHFEKLLPYAFALGIEHEWSEKFKTILDKAQYQPQWHNSPSTLYFSDHFGRNFSQSISSAATKPSKSGSGSGGGGFSGGGGGGGGVGGW